MGTLVLQGIVHPVSPGVVLNGIGDKKGSAQLFLVKTVFLMSFELFSALRVT